MHCIHSSHLYPRPQGSHYTVFRAHSVSLMLLTATTSSVPHLQFKPCCNRSLRACRDSWFPATNQVYVRTGRFKSSGTWHFVVLEILTQQHSTTPLKLNPQQQHCENLKSHMSAPLHLVSVISSGIDTYISVFSSAYNYFLLRHW